MQVGVTTLLPHFSDIDNSQPDALQRALLVANLPNLAPPRVRRPQPIYIRHPLARVPDTNIQGARRGGHVLRLESDGHRIRERRMGPDGEDMERGGRE